MVTYTLIIGFDNILFADDNIDRVFSSCPKDLKSVESYCSIFSDKIFIYNDFTFNKLNLINWLSSIFNDKTDINTLYIYYAGNEIEDCIIMPDGTKISLEYISDHLDSLNINNVYYLLDKCIKPKELHKNTSYLISQDNNNPLYKKPSDKFITNMLFSRLFWVTVDDKKKFIEEEFTDDDYNRIKILVFILS